MRVNRYQLHVNCFPEELIDQLEMSKRFVEFLKSNDFVTDKAYEELQNMLCRTINYSFDDTYLTTTPLACE